MVGCGRTLVSVALTGPSQNSPVHNTFDVYDLQTGIHLRTIRDVYFASNIYSSQILCTEKSPIFTTCSTVQIVDLDTEDIATLPSPCATVHAHEERILFPCSGVCILWRRRA